MLKLPILNHKEEIIKAVIENQVVIVVGETGSGKTTQIPLFLFEANLGLEGKIGITQPRRVAATSVAKFVADQLGCSVGEEVGYQIRFDDSTTTGTYIKFMTDGILLREMQIDPMLNEYSVIVVDEAHERSLNMDFLLGLLKDLLRKRPDLKVIVSSATIEERKFSQYFSYAPVINVSGRTFPVNFCYQDQDIIRTYRFDEFRLVLTIVDRVKEIHQSNNDGDILVFMTGEDDILRVVRAIEEQKFSNLVCLPLYGSMDFEDQLRVFESHKERKVIVATNIAETSITIDGVVYVIDAGWVKQMNFCSQTGISNLSREKISKDSAQQRAGRAGRTQPGVCYRLFTQEDFKERPEHTLPEIQRSDLASVVLQMKILGIGDIENFDFIDSPNKLAFHSAYETLIALGALDENNGVTEIGKLMASLPLEPRLSRMVIAAKIYGCVDEICTIAAFLSSIRSVFARPKNKEVLADFAHQKFRNSRSDFLTFLNVYSEYIRSDYDPEWCFRNFLNKKVLEEIRNIKKQLIVILSQAGISISTNSRNTEGIAKSVAAGLVQNLCRCCGSFLEHQKGGYLVYIHPSSSLFRSVPSWIVAASIVETSKVFARNCGAFNIQWIEEIAPQLCRKDTEYLFYSRKGKNLIATEHIFFGDYEVDQKQVVIPETEAREIQKKRIEEAEKKGWIKLFFVEREFELIAVEGGKTYKVSHQCKKTPITGREYYCSIVEKDNFLGSNIVFVNLKFEIFEFD